MTNNHLREQLHTQELIISNLERTLELLHSIRLEQQKLIFDNFGIQLFVGDTVEILTGTNQSIHAGTLASITALGDTEGPNCWCSVRIWSGPQAGNIYKRKAKNLRKLLEE